MESDTPHMIDIIEPASWPTVRDALPDAEFLLDKLIPSGGTTLLHGPPGCGKSAFAWGVANAISTGAPYLGLSTTQGKVLLISTDMNIYEYKLRWGTNFTPEFAFVCVPKLDITSQTKFKASELFKSIRLYAERQGPRLVIFDALGGLHTGRSSKDDEVATLVDAGLELWLPDTAKLLLAHDRKVRYDANGDPVSPGTEDFMGSQMWRANATSQVHIWRQGRHLSILRHDKSQVSVCLENEIKLYIDMHGKAELWNDKRANDVAAKAEASIGKLGLHGASPSEQVRGIATDNGISERTAWRWHSLWKGTEG